MAENPYQPPTVPSDTPAPRQPFSLVSSLVLFAIVAVGGFVGNVIGNAIPPVHRGVGARGLEGIIAGALLAALIVEVARRFLRSV